MNKLKPDTPEFYQAREKVRLAYKERADLLLDGSETSNYIKTLDSLLSVSSVRMSRLLHYYLFAREDGTMPKLKNLNVESLEEQQVERFEAIKRYAKLRSNNSGYLPSELEPHRSELESVFPGLSSRQLGEICGVTANLVKGMLLLQNIRLQPKTRLVDIAAYLTLIHGRGYIVIEEGVYSSLESYLQDEEGVKTEAAHEVILRQVRKAVDELTVSRLLHPVAFISKLAELQNVGQAASQELQYSKNQWVVSKGAERTPLSDSVDVMLHVGYLRRRMQLPANARVKWKELAEIAATDVFSPDAEEAYTRKLYSRFTKEPFQKVLELAETTPECENGLHFLSEIALKDILDHAIELEARARASS